MNQVHTANSEPKQGKRRRVLTVLTLLICCAGAAWGAWWHFVLRYQESTDDAYVAGNLVNIMSQIPGTVTSIRVDDHQEVKAGQLLLTLDPVDAELAYDNAQSKLADTVRSTRRLMAELAQLETAIRIRRIALDQVRDNLERRQVLGARNAVGREELNTARNNFLSAQHALEQAREQRSAVAALLLDTDLARQPAVLLAASAVRERWLALERTRLVSPLAGQVAKRSVQVGQQVAPGRPLMTVVPLNDVWVDANFKEVQLADLRMGQPVTVTVDMYGKSTRYKGEVAGFAAGTGSVFSILPPQNATGNWIKIVQRVPVRIRLDAAELAARPLLLGLSCTVKVDISRIDGPPLTAAANPDSSSLHTTAFNVDFAPVNERIAQIIEDNSRDLATEAGHDNAARR